VVGHRSPGFSLNSTTQWALDVLAALTFQYDTSISPMAGKRYGWPGFDKTIHKIDLPSGRSIIEAPMSTITVLSKEFHIGGGYMRHFPYSFTKWAIKHTQKTRPVIVYMHPYEIETELRSFSTEHLAPKDKSKGIKHHKLQLRNRHTVPRKVNKLLSQFDFAPLKRVISESLKVALE